jgi:hypothetical protein
MRAVLERRGWRAWYGWAAAAVVVSSTALVLWKVPKWQVAYLKNVTPEQRFDRENEARKTLAQILGGLFVLVGTGLTVWNVRIAERSQRASQRSAQETLRISLEGQITDRFTKAISQLGDSKLVIRIGGIYALERIARDSRRDHWTIMEVFTTHIREYAPWAGFRMQQMAEDAAGHDSEVQAILTVLGRREKGHEEPNQVLNLSCSDLGSAVLDKGDFSGANFTGANLNDVSGSRANFKGSCFRLATLAKANLYEANLEGAVLQRADLAKCMLASANLSGADLSDANLDGANLSKTDFRGAILLEARGLTNAQIKWAITDETTKLPANLRTSE